MYSELKKILIVDDEEDLCEILQYNLSNKGYFTEIAHSAEEAMKRSLSTFDLILLDVMMGKMSGFKFADKLRNEMNLAVSIIFLSAKNTENDILTAYSLGADDYISKPFSINELTARVKAVLKRSVPDRITSRNNKRYGGIQLNPSRRSLMINDEQEDLTNKEFDILKLVLENQGQIFSREDILKQVWGKDVIVQERSVDVNVTKLRTKLGKYRDCLRNKPGYGYYFEF